MPRHAHIFAFMTPAAPRFFLPSADIESYNLEMNTKKYLCDFCNDMKPAWEHPCRSFTTLGGVVESVDAWLACDGCHTLIVAENWDGLAARCALLLSWDASLVLAIQDEFRKNRIGPPRKYGTA